MSGGGSSRLSRARSPLTIAAIPSAEDLARLKDDPAIPETPERGPAEQRELPLTFASPSHSPSPPQPTVDAAVAAGGIIVVDEEQPEAPLHPLPAAPSIPALSFNRRPTRPSALALPGSSSTSEPGVGLEELIEELTEDAFLDSSSASSSSSSFYSDSSDSDSDARKKKKRKKKKKKEKKSLKKHKKTKKAKKKKRKKSRKGSESGIVSSYRRDKARKSPYSSSADDVRSTDSDRTSYSSDFTETTTSDWESHSLSEQHIGIRGERLEAANQRPEDSEDPNEEMELLNTLSIRTSGLGDKSEDTIVASPLVDRDQRAAEMQRPMTAHLPGSGGNRKERRFFSEALGGAQTARSHTSSPEGPYSAAFSLTNDLNFGAAGPSFGQQPSSVYSWPRSAGPWLKYFGSLQAWQRLRESSTPSRSLVTARFMDPPHWDDLPVQGGWVQMKDLASDKEELERQQRKQKQKKKKQQQQENLQTSVMTISRLGRKHRVPIHQANRIQHRGRRYQDELRWFNKQHRVWQDQRPVMLSQLWEEQFELHSDRLVRFVNRHTTRSQDHRPIPADLLPREEAVVLEMMHRFQDMLIKGATFPKVRTRKAVQPAPPPGNVPGTGRTDPLTQRPSSPGLAYSSQGSPAPQHFSSVGKDSRSAKRRWVWLTSNHTYLCWGKADQSLTVKGRLGVSQITHISQHTLGSLVGPEAAQRVLKQAQNNPQQLQRVQAKLRSYTKQLVITTPEIVLELEAEDVGQARDWYNALSFVKQASAQFRKSLEAQMAREAFWPHFEAVRDEHQEQMYSGIACRLSTVAYKREDLSLAPPSTPRQFQRSVTLPMSRSLTSTPRSDLHRSNSPTPISTPRVTTPRTPNGVRMTTPGSSRRSPLASSGSTSSSLKLPGRAGEDLGCTDGLWSLQEFRNGKSYLVWIADGWTQLAWGPTLSKTRGKVPTQDLLDVHVDGKNPARVCVICHGRNLDFVIPNAGLADDLVRAVRFVILFRSYLVRDADLISSPHRKGRLFPWP